jgi:hypothetical protein
MGSPLGSGEIPGEMEGWTARGLCMDVWQIARCRPGLGAWSHIFTSITRVVGLCPQLSYQGGNAICRSHNLRHDSVEDTKKSLSEA